MHFYGFVFWRSVNVDLSLVLHDADPSMQNSKCQVPGCDVGLFDKLVRKVRICDKHRHALKLQMDGYEGRFCQQCSRVHNIDRFDGSRRGCRSRLLSRRRRKTKERCAMSWQ